MRSDVRPPQPLGASPPSAHRSLALAKREISRNDLESAETFLLEALDPMPALPDACVDLVRVQVALAKREDARDTAKDCRRMLLDLSVSRAPLRVSIETFALIGVIFPASGMGPSGP